MMLRKVKGYVEKHHMLDKQDKVIVGVSGGADSICLLFVLLELRKEIPFEMVAVHVNHGLRGKESDEDEAYVTHICKEQEVPLEVYRENVELFAKNRKQSTEEAGREVRLQCFAKALRKHSGTKIALAHHMNDNAETFFMNLARGTGLKGLGGMRPVQENRIRPLLCLERKEIEAFLEQCHIAYCTDKTNASDDYTRNRIRNHVVPYLQENINSEMIPHIYETMEQLQQIQEFLDKQVQALMKVCVVRRDKGYVIDSDTFQPAETVLKPLVVKQILTKLAKQEKDLQAVHIRQVQELFEKQVGRRIDLPYELEARRIYEGVLLQKKVEKPEQVETTLCFKQEESCTFMISEYEIAARIFNRETSLLGTEQKTNTKWFDYDIIKNGVSIRTRREGDYLTIHPDGRTQKLKSYFINEKIPNEQRDSIILVADGSHILWIAGYRTSCYYQPTKKTKRILEIRINKGENDVR